jgi:Family of unknown function (DUF6505)
MPSPGLKRFPRTLRLDNSDDKVFARAAASGEWAVPGGFAFADATPDSLTGKARQAFRNGFLGTASFGWSTLVAVAEIDDASYAGVIEALAAHFIAVYGAPDRASALAAATAEAEFAAGLCQHKINTLLSIERDFGDTGVIERFRAVEAPREPAHAKIWRIVEDGNG